jgi:PKD repeat protein
MKKLYLLFLFFCVVLTGHGQLLPDYVAGLDTNISPARVCRDYIVRFENITPGVDSVYWTFPGGLPPNSSAQVVNVTWPVNGTRNCNITVFNLDGSFSRNFSVIVSNNKPPVSIPAVLPVVCSSDPPFFPSQASPTGGFLIGPSISNNRIDPNLASIGTNTIGYYVRGVNGCYSDTVYATFDMIPGPTAILNDPNNFNNCNGYSPATPTFTLVLNDFSTAPPGDSIINYRIFWGDGSPPFNSTSAPDSLIHTYGGQGVFTLTYIVTAGNGCTDTVRYQVANTTNPSSLTVINPGGTNGCSPVTVTFPLSTTNTDPSITYSIDFGDGKPPITFGHPPPPSITYVFDTTSCLFPGGFFNIRATATNACVTTTSSVQGPFVTQPGIAEFAVPVPGGCVGTPISFQNLSIPGYNNACNRLSVFTWDFGDGSPPVTQVSTTPIPPPGVHTYSQPGIYAVRLILASGGNLCPGDTFIDTVCIGEKPVAAATPTNLTNCVPFTISPTNTTSLTSFCDNVTIQWEVTPATGWTILNNGTLNDFQPQFQFTDPGNYQITMRASNYCGQDTLFWNVIARDVPDIQFPAILNFCDTAILDFRPGSPFAPIINPNNSPVTNYLWSVTPGSFDMLAGTLADTGFSARFSPGNYTITLTATNGCGSNSVSTNFDVAFLTSGGFIKSADSGCAPLNLNVQSTSSPFANHEWRINGQVYSTAMDTNMVLTNTSTTQDSIYEIRLLVFSSPICADTIIQFVKAFAQPNPDFTVDPVCIGGTSFFQDSSQALNGIVSYQWNFGDGNSANTTSPLHNYASPGRYPVSLTVTDGKGCTAIKYDTAVVAQRPLVNFSWTYSSQPDSICVGDTVFFNNQTTVGPFGFQIVGYEWDILNDGVINATSTNTFWVFNSPGVYNIRLRARDTLGCTADLVRTVFVSDPPNPQVSISNRKGCGPLQVSVTNNSTGYISNYNWSFFTINPNGTRNVLFSSTSANPNPVPAFAATGVTNTNVYVRLRTSNACYVDSIIDTITVLPRPIPFFQFSPPTGCSPLTITIQTDGFVTGQPDSIVFSFGDGTPDQVLRPTINLLPNGDTLFTWNQRTHTYVYNGLAVDTTYQLVLRAINACGDSTYSQPVVVKSKSVQSFFTVNSTIGCAPFALQVTDGSFASDNVSYCFDYDTVANVCNGPVLGARNGTHIFNAYGTYVVAQFANNDCGFDTSWVVVQVRPTPNPDFLMATSICAETPLTFTNISTINLGFITGYEWDFGDGNTSTQTSPAHTYAAPGTYQVCLTASSATNCDSTMCKTIVVRNRPFADFDIPIDVLCVNEQPVAFVNNSFDSLTNIASYIWYFGDGNTSAAVNPFHIYALPGVYDVKLIVFNTSGCADSITKQVTIQPMPEALFSYQVVSQDSCGVPQTLQFSNSSNGSITYFWDFNLDNPGVYTSTLTHPTFTYTAPGTYRIRLIAQNGLGCTDTLIQQYRIHPIPDPDLFAQPFEGCEPLSVDFFNRTTLPPGFQDVLNYKWYFGDGNISLRANPTHVYQRYGIYDVSLAVTSEFGCYDSIHLPRYIEVFQRPEPTFTSQIMEFALYQFRSRVVDGLPPYTYFWEFGDGRTSTAEHPLHRFNIQAVDIAMGYNVCLTVTDANNCDVTVCDTLDVGMFTLYVPNAMAPNAFGEGALFLPKGQGLESYHLQIFDRWGNKIWESTALDPETAHPTEGWDGKHKGVPVPIGTYTWRIDAKFANGKMWRGSNFNGDLQTNTGFITIIR